MTSGSAIHDALDVVMKKGENVFVYGTLRKDERADISRSGQFSVDFLGKDVINGRLYHLGSYPGLKFVHSDYMVFDGNMPTVVGEVFYMKDSSVGAILDAYESYPHLYGREQVVTQSGRVVWVYVYNGLVTGDQEIETGDWKNPRLSVSRSIPQITVGKIANKR